jgi:formylglycine-generating enzyme
VRLQIGCTPVPLCSAPQVDRWIFVIFRNWWEWKRGAYWRHPEGRGSFVAARLDHPVVHVVLEDALTYAGWAGKTLPSEAEWEFAARGGLEGAEFARGDELLPGEGIMANTWYGEFPWRRTGPPEIARTSPVGMFRPNGYRLFDMIGNVWEWTTDWFATQHTPDSETPCCVPHNPRGGTMRESLDPRQPTIRIPRKVVKGGSFLYAPQSA